MNPSPPEPSPPPRRRPRDRRGVAAIEFALLAPFMMLSMLGMADVVDYLRVALRLERTAGELTNIVAQYEILRDADFATVFDVAQRIAGSLDVTQSSGAVIVTGVANEGVGAATLWSRRSGSTAFATQVRPVGTSLSVGASGREVTLGAGQGAVVVEVFLPRDPWFYSRGIWGLVQGGGPARPATPMATFSLQRPRVAAILRVAAP